MKTSNYIIIAFFTFLFGGVLVLFVAAKFHPQDKMISVNKTLEPFSVIIAETGAEFTMKIGDPTIYCFSNQDTCYLPRFDIRNDTLIIFAYADNNSKQDLYVYCKSINEIQGKENSHITVYGIPNSSLSINLNKAKFLYYQDPNCVKDSVVKLSANESDVKINSAGIEKLEVQLNKTKINAWNSSIQSISGTLKNRSEVYARVQKNIAIEADSTSEYNILK